jgi:hypothetical protein
LRDSLNHADRLFSMAAGGTFDLKSLVEQLGKEFQRRDMPKHLALLRGFYRSEFLRKRESGGWTADLVLEWLALLQIEPFGRIYPVQPRSAACPFCSAKKSDGAAPLWVETAWEGGAKIRCGACKGAWLLLE